MFYYTRKIFIYFIFQLLLFFFFTLGGAFMGQQDTEGINKSLESLCVSMTNHALEGW